MDAGIPQDFQRVIDFHGHLCGGLTIGYRAAKALMAELGARRDEDEELVAIVENDSCAVDAIQFVTGCTFGKGNFVFRDYGKMAFTLWNRGTGKGVRVCRRPGARGLSTEELLAMKTEELFDIRPAQGETPDRARIHESEPCAVCGETTMLTRLVETDRGRVCIACAEKGG